MKKANQNIFGELSPLEKGAGGIDSSSPLEKGAGGIDSSSPLEKGAGGIDSSSPLEKGAGGIDSSSPLEKGAGGIDSSSPLEKGAGGIDSSSPLEKGAGGIDSSPKSHYNKKLKSFARKLRNNSTPGEIKLWKEALRSKKMLGFQFLRQFPIDNYIADFACRKLKLIIEVDGYSHNFKHDEDKKRDKRLGILGYTVLRFEEREVINDFDNVIRTLEGIIGQMNSGQSPRPSFLRGRSPQKIAKVLKILLFLFALFLSSCSDWFDINKDPNNPDQANEKLTISAGISSVAYVYGGKYQVLGALWSQQWTQSPGASQYSGLDSYDINSSTYDSRQYGELYSGALKNLEYVKNLARQKENWGYYLIASVMQCYTFQILADLYDEIPFSQALKGDEGITSPVYEKGQDIYDSLIVRLDEALSHDFEAETVEEVGDEDLLFQGNIERWKQFANTLKLKIYLREVYKDPSTCETGIKALYSNTSLKLLTNDAAMTQFVNETGKSNPLYETEIRFFNNPNLILSNTLYSFLSDKGDLDRLNAMFDYPETGGGHKALVQGNYNDPEEPTGTNSTSFSKPVILPSTPVYIMSESEACFLQAEAIIRYNVKPYSTAKDLYNQGIEASFIRLLYPYGYSFTEITTLAEQFYGPGQPYEFPAEGSPVEDLVKAIIVQKWIALEGIQSLETFFEHNRTHYPKESAVPASDESNYVPGEFTVSVNNVTSGKFPKRLIFPESEYSSNINTPDKKEVFEKVWWDVKSE